MTTPEKPTEPPNESNASANDTKKITKPKRALDAEAKLAAKPEQPSSSPIQSSPIEEKQVVTPTPSHDHKHEDCPTCNKSIGEHFVRQSEPFCATCGEKNPNFKSAAYCSTCGLPLGTVEHAKTLSGCPNCGGTKAKEFKYQ